MGYEVKIYVGERYEDMPENGADYFSVAGMIDICKPGYHSDSFKLCAERSDDERYPLIRGYFRSGDGSVTEDPYGKKLRAIPLDLALDAVKADAGRDEYRRFKIAVDFLEAFKKHFTSDRLAVVMYGY